MARVTLECSVTDCRHNANGDCTRDTVFVSDAETGTPVCQDAEFD